MMLSIEQMASHCSGGQSSASHCQGRGSIPGLSLWDLRWTKWNISNIFSEDCDSLLPISIHQCSIFIQINTNASVNNTTLYFIYNKNGIWLGRQYVTFRPSEKTDPRAIYISMHYGIPNAYRLYYRNVALSCVLADQMVYVDFCNIGYGPSTILDL